MKNGTYTEYNSFCKFPFPFSNRDLAMRQWSFLHPNKKEAILIYESKKGVKEKRGFIRADIECKYFIFVLH